MGYQSSFRIVVKNPETGERLPPAMRAPIMRERVYRTSAEDPGLALRDVAGKNSDVYKWYEWKADLTRISAKFPGVLIVLRREGEDSGDIEKAYFLGGKVQVAPAKVTFEKFDKSKLR